jgi:hypothetical protein
MSSVALRDVRGGCRELMPGNPFPAQYICMYRMPNEESVAYGDLEGIMKRTEHLGDRVTEFGDPKSQRRKTRTRRSSVLAARSQRGGGLRCESSMSG